MIIGTLISFIAFGGIAYFLSRACFRAGIDRDNRVLAVLFYFLGPLVTLSLISLLIVGVYSLFGFSISLAVEALANHFQANSSGAFVVLGSILTAIFGIAAIAAGPATAFTASQVSVVVAIVMVLVQKDREFCAKWLPWVACAAYGFCMWPFAAILTFGL
jgi:hypothetical protein